MNTLSWGNLTTPPASTETLDWLAGMSLLVFGLVFIVTMILTLWPRSWGLSRRIGRERTRQWVAAGLWLSSLGMIFLILRFLQIDPLTFGRPIWLLVTVAAVAAWLGWLAAMLYATPTPVAQPTHNATRRPRKGGSYR